MLQRHCLGLAVPRAWRPLLQQHCAAGEALPGPCSAAGASGGPGGPVPASPPAASPGSSGPVAGWGHDLVEEQQEWGQEQQQQEEEEEPVELPAAATPAPMPPASEECVPATEYDSRGRPVYGGRALELLEGGLEGLGPRVLDMGEGQEEEGQQPAAQPAAARDPAAEPAAAGDPAPATEPAAAAGWWLDAAQAAAGASSGCLPRPARPCPDRPGALGVGAWPGGAGDGPGLGLHCHE